MVLQVQAISIFRGHYDPPHSFVAGLFRRSNYRDHVEVIPSRIEADASLVLGLRALAGQVSRVRSPCVRSRLAVARVHDLDHAPSLIGPGLRPSLLSSLASDLRSLGVQVPLFQTHPPRHQGSSLLAGPIRSDANLALRFVESPSVSHRIQPLPASAKALARALRFRSERTFRGR